MKIRFFFESFNQTSLKNGVLALKEKLTTIKGLPYTFSDTLFLPLKKKKFCILTSPHINKNSREQFEVRIYKSFIDLTFFSKKIPLNFLLNLELPINIKIKTIILEF